jgi:EAL domain-containing protein (putative c-di-GMP-specific phosphodiesterase class I)
LWYQPKIDLKSRRICGAKALIRLRHPTRGILLPAKFLPPTGDPLHLPLADFVIWRALTDWSFFAADQITPKLAINMPISIFETPEFVSNLRKYLPGDPNFPGLIVESTEDEVVSDPDLAHEVAIQLKLYNIGVAIDDFGSGHATLDQAQVLPFTELKIDRSKVDGCSRAPSQYLECRQIVELAHRLGMTAVAEGGSNRRTILPRWSRCNATSARARSSPGRWSGKNSSSGSRARDRARGTRHAKSSTRPLARL